nr:rod-binding protein [Pseudaminobacter soli]
MTSESERLFVAISPPSDIVLDVARAVEPEGVQAARAALAQRSGAPAPASSDAAFSVNVANQTAAPGLSRSAEPAGRADAYKRFEAVVLQTFVRSMLPKEAEQVYGKGMAGDMWKSMMAERLADVIADRGGIGIASRLLAGHYVEGEKKVSIGPISRGTENTEADMQSSLSTALLHELQRKAAQSLRGIATTSDKSDT